MKRILLSSAAVVAFAGAASAQELTGVTESVAEAAPLAETIGVTLSGTAILGYNDRNNSAVTDDNIDFFSDLEIQINLSVELDNGLVAAASIDLEDLAGGQGAGEEDTTSIFGVETSEVDFELSLTSQTAGLFYGDTAFAADNTWIEVGNMDSDNFSEADGEEVIRAQASYAGVDAAVSYAISNANGDRNLVDTVSQLSIGASYEFNGFTIIGAYQDSSDEAAGFFSLANGDFNEDEVYGVSVATTYAGADIRIGYANDEGRNTDSYGVEVSYPFGPVTATAFYVVEDDFGSNTSDNYGLEFAYEQGPLSVTATYEHESDGSDDYALEGSYQVSEELILFAGYLAPEAAGEDGYYIGGEYDLGSGASLEVSFADGDDAEFEDEIGSEAFQSGTTIQLEFDF